MNHKIKRYRMILYSILAVILIYTSGSALTSTEAGYKLYPIKWTLPFPSFPDFGHHI